MATLHRLIDLGEPAPGFILPVFRPYVGANYEVAQIITPNDRVAGFRDVHPAPGSTSTFHLGEAIQTSEGEQAIWALRDQRMKVHVGTAAAIRKISLDLLTHQAFDDFPLVAAEIAAFCKSEPLFPTILLRAFELLRQESEASADVWRDSVVLLPHLRNDIRSTLNKKTSAREMIDSVRAFTKGDVTHLFCPTDLVDFVGSTKFDRWRALAPIFGIREIEIHAYSSDDPSKNDVEFPWALFGFAGIANRVITSPPFRGGFRTIFGGTQILLATGHQERDSSDKLIVAIIGSEMREAESANVLADTFADKSAHRHLINIRPIGFGSPRASKASPLQIMDLSPNFDFCWIASNHRQRQSGRYPQVASLSASSFAARQIRAAATALIECRSSAKARRILNTTRNSRGFGLFGAARYLSREAPSRTIKRVLYSMLCQEAHLHTAKEIYILWPKNWSDEDVEQPLTIGRHKYNFTIIEMPPKFSRNRDVIGFAIDVNLSKQRQSDFTDYCVSLFGGFGWVSREETNKHVILENEGEVLSFYASQFEEETESLIENSPKFSSEIIVTNHGLRAKLMKKAQKTGWKIIHCSGIQNFLEDEYRDNMFE